ncbi:MAG: hypothetical protein QOI10_4027 [Solirubrobacterales bacterium]|nr:hypothetical protein [Solirubrobacterales bacterium]
MTSTPGATLSPRDPAPRTGRGSGLGEPEPSPTEQFQASARRLLAMLLDRAFGVALEQVERLAQTFDDIAAHGGLQLNAVLGGVRATLEGRNPIWGAITGAVSALSPAAKVALATALILALLLLPVTVVLLLLALIIGVVAAAVRAGSTGG